MRSHYCGQITENHIGNNINVTGWVFSIRDHGGVLFIDLWDHTGLLQVVVAPEVYDVEQSNNIRAGTVLLINGTIDKRPEHHVNENITTSNIELNASKLQIIGKCNPLPFSKSDYDRVSEEVRLKNRCIDLRTDRSQSILRLKHKICHNVRCFLDENGFIEVETPQLTTPTPEGARDYLVPSRNFPGNFYALPQSPQLFKQMLMIAGCDRYFQFARCFRDEDLRADRQPEFTQIDLEMSFVDANAVKSMTTKLIKQIFKSIKNIDLPEVLPEMSWIEAMNKYGSDKPDLRNPLELVDVSDLMKNVDFKVFKDPAEASDSKVAALRVPNGAKLSRSQIDSYTKYVGKFKAKGLAYIKVNNTSDLENGLQSPILKFLPINCIKKLLETTRASDGDIIFFGADKTDIVHNALGALRNLIGQDLDLIDNSSWAILWVTKFPMFLYEEELGRYAAQPHPFTQPILGENQTLDDINLDNCLSNSYDLVINGHEVAGGSIRISDYNLQMQVLKLLGLDKEQAHSQFHFLLNALQYGCPPHGGIAFGLERLVMLLSGTNNIRDVMAFPKTQSASCSLTKAPGKAKVEQLVELGLKIIGEKK